ncbi:Trp family transcriptional regulator [Patescibacteria group bacterium]|nr:Trp family transcriptional regulator [Patescibacteria group bacterium]
MRTSGEKLNPSLATQITKTLSLVIAGLKNRDEVDIFLKDFLKAAEYETFAKRLAVAYWLKKGRSYTNIKNNLKVSSATIAQVQKDMNKKGFSQALKRLEAEEWANLWEKKIKNFIK